MVDIDKFFTAIIHLKNVSVAVVPPPRAQLAIPPAGQRMEELRVLHADHGEEVLVPQVAPEAILVC